MKLLTLKDLLTDAQKRRYAIPAFSMITAELVPTLIKVAEEERSPIILHPRAVKEQFDYIKALSEASTIPIALNLDHGRNFEAAMRAIRLGYTSVMIDGSSLPFEENVAVTKKVVDAAHAVGISTEAELGHLAGKVDARSVEDGDKGFLTEPLEAKDFVEKTGADCLAVAIGTAHGPYKFKGTPKLDIDRLVKIKELVQIPLVLHGGSSVPQDIVAKAKKYGAHVGDMLGNTDSEIIKAIDVGITKINIGTDLRLSYLAGLREIFVEKPEVTEIPQILGAANAIAGEVARGRMKAFRSSGKA